MQPSCGLHEKILSPQAAFMLHENAFMRMKSLHAELFHAAFRPHDGAPKTGPDTVRW
jgi:hypothetical protein